MIQAVDLLTIKTFKIIPAMEKPIQRDFNINKVMTEQQNKN